MSATEQPLLLVGWDGSERARDAVALAGVLARECGFAVHAVQTYPSYETFGLKSEIIDKVRTRAEESLAGVPQSLLKGIEFEAHEIQGASPAEGLHRHAEKVGASLIVVGSTHHGALGRVVPGSVAENLLHGSPCAVAVAPVGYADAIPESIAVIAAAYDGSPAARAGVDEAVRLAMAVPATVRVIEVVGAVYGWGLAWTPAAYVGLNEIVHEDARKGLDALVHELPAEVRAEVRLVDGDPVRKLLAECETGVDLLVMGSRGYGAVRRVLLGSTSAKVIRSAPCPVIVVPGPRAVERLADPSENSGAVALTV